MRKGIYSIACLVTRFHAVSIKTLTWDPEERRPAFRNIGNKKYVYSRLLNQPCFFCSTLIFRILCSSLREVRGLCCKPDFDLFPLFKKRLKTLALLSNARYPETLHFTTNFIIKFIPLVGLSFRSHLPIKYKYSDTYFHWISKLSPILFKTISFKPFIKVENSSVIMPIFWALLAFCDDIYMICDTGSTLSQHLLSFLITWRFTAFASFSGTWSHLLHTNNAHFVGSTPCLSSVTSLTLSSNFPSCKKNKEKPWPLDFCKFAKLYCFLLCIW